MRYRKLDESGDMTFGSGSLNFYIDQPESVGQAVQTRLQQHEGEWFLDKTDGTPWETEIAGYTTSEGRDLIMRERILGTPGAVGLVSFAGSAQNRDYSVATTVQTVYSKTAVDVEALIQ